MSGHDMEVFDELCILCVKFDRHLTRILHLEMGKDRASSVQNVMHAITDL